MPRAIAPARFMAGSPPEADAAWMILPLLLAATGVSAVPPCRPGQIRATADGRQGDFNGMSHGGTLLVLRNVGGRACSVPGLPAVTMLDARGHRLPASRKAPVGMHPGPVVRPVVIAAGGRVNAPLRWVAGPVYDHNRCVTAAAIGVTIGGRMLRASGGGQLCGEAGTTIGFDQPVLTATPFR